ncbi:MAG: hypothetical protein AB7S61_10670 [Methanoregulaceae archaeon]
MVIFSPKQREIAGRIEADVAIEMWKDWRWQIAHAITDIDTFERLLDLEFEPEKRALLEETIRKFPHRITPYNLSHDDTRNHQQGPI